MSNLEEGHDNFTALSANHQQQQQQYYQFGASEFSQNSEYAWKCKKSLFGKIKCQKINNGRHDTIDGKVAEVYLMKIVRKAIEKNSKYSNSIILEGVLHNSRSNENNGPKLVFIFRSTRSREALSRSFNWNPSTPEDYDRFKVDVLPKMLEQAFKQ